MTISLARSFTRFLIVGVLNTGLGLAVIFAAKALLGWGDVAANMLGYGVGLAVSFVLNRNWSFAHRGAVLPALVRFLGAFLLAYAVNLATVLVLIRVSAVNSYLAQAIGVVPYTLVFFAASRLLVFAPRRPA